MKITRKTINTVAAIASLLKTHCPEKLKETELKIKDKVITFHEQLLSYYANHTPIFSIEAIEHFIWRNFVLGEKSITVEAFIDFFELNHKKQANFSYVHLV